MTPPRILVVEDEGIVAKDIQMTLRRLGYEAPATAATSEEALEKAAALAPDLAFMDINLRGDMDGIETATRLRERWSIPVIFLTAYADEATLARAKVAEPFGYLIKPFDERDLRTAVEIALYKHAMEAKLKQHEHLLATLLRSMGDAVVGLDADARVTFMNPRAEALTGWTLQDVAGAPLADVISLTEGPREHPLGERVAAAARHGEPLRLDGPLLLSGRDGHRTPVDGTLSPLLAGTPEEGGAVLVLRDLTERSRAEALAREVDSLRARLRERARTLI